MSRTVTYTIRYVYGSYSGMHDVTLTGEQIDMGVDPCRYMWAEFSRKGYLTLGMATQSAKIIDTHEHWEPDLD